MEKSDSHASDGVHASTNAVPPASDNTHATHSSGAKNPAQPSHLSENDIETHTTAHDPKRTREYAYDRRSRLRRHGVFFWLEVVFFTVIFLNAAFITFDKATEGSFGWAIFGIVALILGIGGIMFRFTRPARFDGPVQNTPEQEAELVELIAAGKRVDAARKLRIWHRGLTLGGAVDEVKRIEQNEGIEHR